MTVSAAARLYARHQDVPSASWRWPNFKPSEIACKGTGSVLVVPEALDALQALRTRLGRPLVIKSGYRSPEHNERVGGARASKHMEGAAFDIECRPDQQAALIFAAKDVGFRGFGRYDTFVHVDLGPARTWDERTSATK